MAQWTPWRKCHSQVTRTASFGKGPDGTRDSTREVWRDTLRWSATLSRRMTLGCAGTEAWAGCDLTSSKSLLMRLQARCKNSELCKCWMQQRVRMQTRNTYSSRRRTQRSRPPFPVAFYGYKNCRTGGGSSRKLSSSCTRKMCALFILLSPVYLKISCPQVASWSNNKASDRPWCLAHTRLEPTVIEKVVAIC